MQGTLPLPLDRLGPDLAPLAAEGTLRHTIETLERELAAVSDAAIMAIDANQAAAVALALSDRAAKLRADAEHYRRDWRVTNRLERATQAEKLAEYNDDLAGRYMALANDQRPAVLVCAKTSEASR